MKAWENGIKGILNLRLKFSLYAWKDARIEDSIVDSNRHCNIDLPTSQLYLCRVWPTGNNWIVKGLLIILQAESIQE